MVLVEVFCFWFSVRLGSVITGFLTLLQCCGLLTTYLVLKLNDNDLRAKLHNFLQEFIISDKAAKNSSYDLDTYILVLVSFLAILAACSILLIIGSFKCKPFLIFPFLTIYPLYIILLLTTHVSVMIGLKNQDIGIGNLILYSNLGGFLMSLLLYMWISVFCFVQIMYELKSELQKNSLKMNNYNKIYLP